MRLRWLTLLALLAASAPAADLPQLKQRGTLRVILARDEQPEMFNLGAGELGFDRELIEGFARRQGLRIEPVVVPTYADRIPALLADKGDAIAGIVVTEERRRLVDFSGETLPARRVVITHKPHPRVNSAEEFRKQKVGLLKGTTTWLGAALEAGVPESEIRIFPDLPTLFEALKAGQITATVMSASDMGIAVLKNPALEPGVTLGAPSSTAWGVRKQDTLLKAAMNEHLDLLRKTPTWSRLVVKYFGQEALLVLGKTGQ